MGDVAIKIATDAAGIPGELEKTKGQVTSWASGLAGNVAKFTGGAVLAGVATLGAAVAGIGVAAFSAASDFDAATKKMQSQLGLTEAGAEKYGETLKKVFGNNFGNDINDVADSIAKVSGALQVAEAQLENESADFLQRATEKSLALRDTYEQDVQATAAAAATLMKNFGLDVNQAYDFITFGLQNGLDANGDFLDSIGEYSTQFGGAGASAEQFFNVMQSGLGGTSLGTDKAADAFKEFRVRIQDGSELTKQGLELVGLNVAKIQKGLADGTITAADAFQMGLDGLAQMTDKTAQFQAGVALYGTQFEDLGTEAFLALSTTGYTLDHMTGAVDKLNKQYETLPAFFEGLRRQAIVAIEPMGSALLDIANAAAPALGKAFTALQPVIAAVSGYVVEALSGVPAMIEEFIAKSNFTWTPEFKQVRLGDLFEWLQTGAEGETVTSFKLGETFSFYVDDITGYKKLTLGDFFSFISDGEGGKAIDLGEYFTFEFKKGKVQEFGIKDLFNISKDGKEIFNLNDFIEIKYTAKEGGGFDLLLGSLGLSKDAKGREEVNLGEFFNLVWTPEGGIKSLKIGDFFKFGESEGGKIDLEGPNWEEFIDQLSWKDIFSVEFSPVWSDYISKLTWADVFTIEFSPKWHDFIESLTWENFIEQLTWKNVFSLEFSPAWHEFIEMLSWTDFIEKLVWPAAITSFKWAEWLVDLIWPSEALTFDWGDWLEKVVWPAAIDLFAWGDWISQLTWPDAIAQFGTWADWVVGIDFTSWVPDFPGWAEVLGYLGIGSAPAATTTPADAAASAVAPYTATPQNPTPGAPPANTTSQEVLSDPAPADNDRGGSRMGRSGVNVGQVVINNNLDAQQFLYDLGQKFAYG